MNKSEIILFETEEAMCKKCTLQMRIDGYAINEKRLHALQKTVDIQTRMLADIMLLEENAQIKDEESIRRKHADVK